jgi:DNA processing protein
MGKEKQQEEELLYRIALTQADRIGDRKARLLLQHFETAKEVFYAGPKKLMAFGVGRAKGSTELRAAINESKIRRELAFIRKHNIQPLFITDEQYPQKLKSCPDAPILIYYKGNVDLNERKLVAIVGTRKNTDYGLRITEELVEGLRAQDAVIVSGLAFGIDVIAHSKAVQMGMPTIGVMAHGMDMIYPSQHRHLTKSMVDNGGLLTEYPSGTDPDRFNFPMRNRIVAGMCDVTVVVETEMKGGAMITAKLAAGYNREVAAYPGRSIDRKSDGCNYLLRTQIAQLITGPEDLIEMMNWQYQEQPRVAQARLFPDLTAEEMRVAKLLEHTDGMHVDELCLKASMPSTELSSLLLRLELNGLVRSVRGKHYRLA